MSEDLARFLADRYDEAEKLACEAEAFDGQVEHRYHAGPNGELLGSITLSMFHAQNGPKRRLADIKLKRAILAGHEHVKVEFSKAGAFGCRVCDNDSEYGMNGDGWCATARQLGTEFASHPAYRPEWAPEGETDGT